MKHVTSIAMTCIIFYSGHSCRRQQFSSKSSQVPPLPIILSEGLSFSLFPCPPAATPSTCWQCARDQVCERVPSWLNGLQCALIAKTVYRLERSDFNLVYGTLEAGTRLPIFSNTHTNARVVVHFP